MKNKVSAHFLLGWSKECIMMLVVIKIKVNPLERVIRKCFILHYYNIVNNGTIRGALIKKIWKKEPNAKTNMIN